MKANTMEKNKVLEQDSDVQTDIDINKNIFIRYAWGCNKTWFITKTKQQIMPKGSRLLMKLGCERTMLPIQTKDTYPTTGDVITDVDGNKLLIVECNFI